MSVAESMSVARRLDDEPACRALARGDVDVADAEGRLWPLRTGAALALSAVSDGVPAVPRSAPDSGACGARDECGVFLAEDWGFRGEESRLVSSTHGSGLRGFCALDEDAGAGGRSCLRAGGEIGAADRTSPARRDCAEAGRSCLLATSEVEDGEPGPRTADSGTE